MTTGIIEKNTYNVSKDMTFVYLWNLLINGNKKGVSVGILSQESCVSYNYLRIALSYWHNLGYLKRKIDVIHRGKTAFVYTLATRGIKYIEGLPPDRFNYAVCKIRELRAKRGKE